MQCYECGGAYEERSDSININDPVVGKLGIRGKKYFKCNNCGNRLFSVELATEIDRAIKNRKQELINSLPIRDFITAKETSELLGISRQALNKNHRINNGFIHQTRLADNIVYVKQSVIQYRNTGDGRYPLTKHNEKYYPAADVYKTVNRIQDYQTQYYKSNSLSFFKITETMNENKEIELYGNKR